MTPSGKVCVSGRAFMVVFREEAEGNSRGWYFAVEIPGQKFSGYNFRRESSVRCVFFRCYSLGFHSVLPPNVYPSRRRVRGREC